MKIQKPLNPVKAGGLCVCIALLLSLSACGLLESKRVDYKSAKRTQPLDIPPELSDPGKDDRYTMSDLDSRGTTFLSYEAKRSENKTEVAKVSALLPEYENFRIERAGMQRWLVASAPAEKVWPLIHDFLIERELELKLVSPETGIIETVWAKKRLEAPEGGIRSLFSRLLNSFYSASEMDQYRIRLEPGTEPGTSDIFISHHGMEEVYINENQDETRWQPRPSDPDLEVQMLRRLMVFLGMEEAKASGLLADTGTPGRARIVESTEAVLLEMDEKFDRAWRRVGLVLDRNGFIVEDRDRAKGIYYVKYNDPLADKKREKKGFFSSLAFWRDNPEDPLLEPEEQFRIVVASTDSEKTNVGVLNKDGETSQAKATVRRMLDLFLRELR